jgi:hypothetical protein
VFKDHFPGQSAACQKYRPDYPAAPIDWPLTLRAGRA